MPHGVGRQAQPGAHDREPTAEIWAKAVRERNLYDTEYRLRRHDGEYRDVMARGVPVLESDGSIREWIGTCTDITPRKQAFDPARKRPIWRKKVTK